MTSLTPNIACFPGQLASPSQSGGICPSCSPELFVLQLGARGIQVIGYVHVALAPTRTAGLMMACEGGSLLRQHEVYLNMPTASMSSNTATIDLLPRCRHGHIRHDCTLLACTWLEAVPAGCTVAGTAFTSCNLQYNPPLLPNDPPTGHALQRPMFASVDACTH